MNMPSMPRNLQGFKHMILQSSALSIYVLGFTDIILDSYLVSLYELTEYSVLFTSRNTYDGGAALYMSNEYDSYVVSHLNISDPNIETLSMHMRVRRKKYLP